MKKLVKNLKVTTFCHATESEKKVLTALFNLIPSEYHPLLRDKIFKTIVYGYHGNPITLIKLVVDNHEIAQNISKNILLKLDKFDKNQLKNTLNLRFEKGKLHLRVNKQEAYLGNVRILESDDVINITITFYPHIRQQEALLKALEDLGVQDD